MKQGTDYIGVGVGAFTLNERGEVLLMRRSLNKSMPGMWIIPGGKVDFGESLTAAVIRETKEEVGVDIVIDREFPMFDDILPDEREHWVSGIFLAHIVGGVPEIREPEKCEEIGWFSLTELPTPLAHSTRFAVDTFLKK